MKKVLLLIASFIVFSIHAQNIELYGIRNYDDVAYPEWALVNFSSATPETVSVINNMWFLDEFNNTSVAGEFANGYLYVLDGDYHGDICYGTDLYKISTVDWSVVNSININVLCGDMAYDITSNTMFALGFVEVSTDVYISKIMTLNLTSGTFSNVVTLNRYFNVLACDDSGQLYGVDENGYFCSIDKVTGTVVQIGSTGFIPYHTGSMAFDHSTDRLFWTLADEENGMLIEINVTTGAGTNLGTIGGNARIVALFSNTLVETFTPANNAINVDENATVSVAFNKNITAGILANVTITPNPGNIVATVNNNVITIAHGDFLPSTIYTVTIPASAITELSHNVSWSFKTACDDVITSFPWTEGFESNFPPGCWGIYNVDGMGSQWMKNYYSTFVHTGSTSAGHSPSAAAIQEGWLVTPRIKIPSEGFTLEFWSYNDDPEDNEYNGVWISTTRCNPTTATFVEVHQLSGNELSDAFKQITVSLDDFVGDSIYIGFKYQGYNADGWYIDDITVINRSSYIDAEVLAITSPITGNGLGVESVKAIIKNNGGNAISNFTLTLNVDGIDVVTETYTGTLAGLAQMEYTFNQTYNFSNTGGYAITVSVNLTDDEVPENDSFTEIIMNIANTELTLYGYLIYDEDLSGYAVVSFSSDNPTVLTIVNDYMDDMNFIVSGEYYDGYLYLFTMSQEYQPEHFVKLSTTTWTATTNYVFYPVCSEMAYDYSTNTMYGVRSNSLYTVDLTSGEMTLVATLNSNFLTLACNLQGQLYGINTNGDFCSINKTTGAATVINNMGTTLNYAQSMAFDHNTGRLFWTKVTDDSGNLIEIDPLNGGTFDRGVLGAHSQIVALHTPFDASTATFVSSFSPANGAVNVEPTASVSVTFNRDITTVDLSGVTISPDPGSVSASATGAVLTIAHDDFDHDTRYTVTVPAGAIDNYTADSPITWSFTVKGSGVSTIDLKAINMYPNPAKNQVQLTNLPEKSNITVYDVTGRVVKTCKANDNSFTMSVDFAPGIYFVKIENNNASTVKKLIVE